MKIALIDVNCDWSSTGKIVRGLSEQLMNRGHTVRVFYGRGPAGNNSEVIEKISSPAEVLFHALLSRLSGIPDGFSPFATRSLIRSLDVFQPDVVHLHDIHGYFINVESICKYFQEKRLAVVWTFHCEIMYTGRCGYSLECDRWKFGCGNCPDLNRYPRSYFFDRSQQILDRKKSLFDSFERVHLTAPSHWLANRMRESIVKKLPISVISNGVDTSLFRPRQSDVPVSAPLLSRPLRVLSVGSDIFSERKGGRFILELSERFENHEVEFIIVGAEAAVNCSSDNVKIFSPIKDQAELAELYRGADLFLLPSEKETFSMVCAEALASGLPVIGFESGAPSEVVPRGYGVFVRFGDINALTLVLRDYLLGKLLLASSGQCRDYARKNFSLDGVTTQFENIYWDITRDG